MSVDEKVIKIRGRVFDLNKKELADSLGIGIEELARAIIECTSINFFLWHMRCPLFS